MKTAIIDLRSGGTIDLLNPDPTAILIEDIAWGLANTCRFGGQCVDFYSVAQHSEHVSRVEQSIEALMHDSPEGYIGDVVGPLKKMLPEYKVIEERFEAAIRQRFGLGPLMTPAIKTADMILLRTEQRDLIKSYDPSWNRGHEPYPDRIIPMSPAIANRKFLRRFKELGGTYAF